LKLPLTVDMVTALHCAGLASKQHR
jgi:hypothetical protein